jgi:hypothetical protein
MHLIRDFKTFTNANPKIILDAFEEQPFLLVKGIFYSDQGDCTIAWQKSGLT